MIATPTRTISFQLMMKFQSFLNRWPENSHVQRDLKIIKVQALKYDNLLEELKRIIAISLETKIKSLEEKEQCRIKFIMDLQTELLNYLILGTN